MRSSIFTIHISPFTILSLLVAGVLLVLLAGCSTGAAPNGQSSDTAAFDDRFTHNVAEVNGVQIHYVMGGSGAPVVLLHGFPETWYTWRGVMSALAEEHTVIAPDLRGVGESSLEDSGYDKETLAEDVYQLVQELGYEEVSVVGHDMGAMAAYAYAREHREEITHLAFMNAGLPGFGLEEYLDFSEEGRGLPHLIFFMQPDTPKLLEGQEREYVTDFLGSEPGEETEAQEEFARAYSRPGRLEAAMKQYGALYQDAEDNREKAMPKLTMPVLAFGGALPLESMQRVAEDVTGESVPGAYHYSQEQQPEEVAGKLLDFLDR